MRGDARDARDGGTGGTMHITEAQQDIRRAYAGGGPGVFVSGLTWLVAALVETRHGVSAGFTALFLGGMLIFPLSKLIVRFLFRRDNEAAANPLGRTALECTIAMIAGLLPAYLFLHVHPAYVFPAAALAVGAHYFVFRTVYGDILFWLLGALICAAALIALFVPAALPPGLIFTVAVIELLFAIVLTLRDRGGAGAGASR
jgi:hypothetical protein